MTAPTPDLTSWQDGDVVGAAGLNAIGTHAGALFARSMGGYRTRKPLVTLATATGRGLNSSTDAQVTWGIEGGDTDNMWTSSDPTKITIQTAGWYRVGLQIHWDTTGSGTRVCRILANGTNPVTNAIATDNRNPVTIVTEGATTFCQCTAHLAAGTILYANVWQNSGSQVTLVTTFSGCWFAAEYLAPY